MSHRKENPFSKLSFDRHMCAVGIHKYTNTFLEEKGNFKVKQGTHSLFYSCQQKN